MRLDKFLQVSRLVKRRVLAKEMCERGQVRVNGGIAKPAREVAVGDLVAIDFGWRVVEVEVTSLPAGGGGKGREMYRTMRVERRDPRA
ncbi:MAG: RNA-binding S4 domain-containing protein [Firmicutes bacterium]|nr:RNA-binding S4 domain-containing protein [Bacillota bacterium]